MNVWDRFRASSIVQGIVALVLLCALVNLWSAVTPGLPERIEFLRGIFSPELREASRLASAFSSFMLVLLARGLLGRKRMAWLITIGVLTVSVLAHIIKGFDIEEAALGAVALIALFATEKEFVARPDLPSIRDGIRIFISAFAFTLLYGTIGFFFLDRQFGQHFDLIASLKETVNMFLIGAWPAPHTRFARWFLGSIYAIAFSSFTIALLSLLRSVIVRHRPPRRDFIKAKAIIEEHGDSSLAQFALLGDKQFFFGAEGNAVIAYTVIRGIALALGDPISPPASLEKAVHEFKAFCRRNGWKPAFYQTSKAFLPVYQDVGFTILPIGQCAIIDLATFSIEGAANKEFRNAVNKFHKEGYVTHYYAPPQTKAQLEVLRSISNQWLSKKGGTEKSFSLGTYTDSYIRSSPIVTVENAAGEVLAFANAVEAKHRRELTVDLMRQKNDTPSGIMLFLLLQALLKAKEQGYATFNLGLAPLAGLAASADASTTEKILHAVFMHVHAPYNFQGLYSFKKKFHPQWDMRYLVYPNPSDGLAVLEAITIADSSTSFWGEIRAELVRRLAGR